MDKMSSKKEVTITGIVIPIEWHGDNVVSIGISTDDDEYLVKVDRVGEELFDFLDEEIRATGIVTKDQRGNNKIFVMDYETLNDDDYYQDEESYDYHDDYNPEA